MVLGERGGGEDFQLDLCHTGWFIKAYTGKVDSTISVDLLQAALNSELHALWNKYNEINNE